MSFGNIDNIFSIERAVSMNGAVSDGGGDPEPSQPTLGNTTFLYQPSYTGGNFTFEHEHDEGDNGHLFLVLVLNGGYNGVAAKYNDVAMTKQDTLQDCTGFGGFGADVVLFDLDDPATGTNLVQVLPGAAYNDKLAYAVYSFTDCSGLKQVPTKNKESSSLEVTAAFGGDVTAGSTIIAAGAGRGTMTRFDWIEMPTGSGTIGPDLGPQGSPGVNAGDFAISRRTNVDGGSYSVTLNHDSSDQCGVMAFEVGGV
jgi:hypothetical protein